MEGSSTRGQWVRRVLPPVLDLVSLTAAIFLVPWLGARLFAEASVGRLFLIPGFVLILAGILAVRRFPDYALDDSKGLSLFAMCLVFFQIVTYSLFYAYATNVDGTESQNDGIAVVVFFLFLVPVAAAFFLPATKAEPDTRKALVAESVGLLSVNYLTMLGAAVWYRFSTMPTSEEAVHPTGLTFLVLFVILYLLFLAFFGLPRLYLLRATGDRIGLTVYLVSLAVFLWDKVPPLD